MTSRMMPNWSKYPPRPSVPNGSLKQICTLLMKFLFHAGWMNWLANLCRTPEAHQCRSCTSKHICKPASQPTAP